jgi:putative phosphoribosyl transferase
MRTLREHNNEHFILVTAGSVRLAGELVIPAAAQGIVMFAHGSGSSRHSPRNRFVASVLQRRGLATLLFDLLTAEEEVMDQRSHQLRFDIGLLTERLVGATDWLLQHSPTRHLHIGYFGASTGSAAALIAATRRPEAVRAIVSRGGRPDLAGFALTQVQAPTLLIVGGADFPVVKMNQEALEQLHRVVEKRLEIVPGATHLFEEPGALEQVSALASQWFQQYLNEKDHE